MKRIYTFLLIMGLSLSFIGCQSKQEPKKNENENPSPNPDDPKVKSELPLLTFTGDVNEITDYEAKLGRFLYRNIKFEKIDFPGYRNDSFEAIPIAIYGFEFGGEHNAIIALGKETLKDCPKLKAMLRDVGFNEPSLKMIGDQEILSCKKEDGVTVEITSLHVEEYGTNTQLFFYKEPAMQINPAAKDFPSVDALMSGQVSEIVDFEKKLGLREPSSDYWDEANVNLQFLAIPAKYESKENNLLDVNYISTSSQNTKYIFCNLKGLSPANLDGIGIREWLANNGFGYDHKGCTEFNYVAACNKDQSVVAQVSVDEQNFFLLIYPLDNGYSTEKMRELAKQFRRSQTR